MQDRVKFRVWDKENNKMFTPPRRFNYSNVNGTIVCIESFCQYDGFYQKRIIKEFNDAILMQCTGLKDENNKLIYEGDVVETWKFSTGITANKVVVWNNHRCGCRLIDISLYNRKILECPQSMVNVTTMKILGNIYENPELLEEK